MRMISSALNGITTRGGVQHHTSDVPTKLHRRHQRQTVKAIAAWASRARDCHSRATVQHSKHDDEENTTTPTRIIHKVMMNVTVRQTEQDHS